jgi:hypothetical protein
MNGKSLLGLGIWAVGTALIACLHFLSDSTWMLWIILLLVITWIPVCIWIYKNR